MSLSKRFTTINGNDFVQMILAGAANLEKNVSLVNGLNVFPVPDGDTGTNMNLTFSSGRDELLRRQDEHIGKAAEALSKGLLMGARGNSGVILSQLFRGLAKGLQDQPKVNPQQFAVALQLGVEMAYKAVVKPVEGTILTVAKEAARHATIIARRTPDVGDLMIEVLQAAKQALANTPNQLPVLKQVGVVDAGGQGLIYIYEGFIQALSGQVSTQTVELIQTMQTHTATLDTHEVHSRSAQSMLATEDIEYGYCTEFMVRLVPDKTTGLLFDEIEFRDQLSQYGDSLLVVADNELVKVHIHAEFPGEVMNHAMRYGDLTRIKIENMREQHTHLLDMDNQSIKPTVEQTMTFKPYGFVTVSVGSGISDIFQSLGVNVVLSGGQTMNPSIEEIVQAIRQVPADVVYVFPNNSNIVLAAEQASQLVEDRTVIVIPTKTIPQGIAAMLAFKEHVQVEANAEAMKRAITTVRSGQVTQSVRETKIDGIAIGENDYLGILDGKIVVADPLLLNCCRTLIDQMMDADGEMITIYSGEQANLDSTNDLLDYIATTYPDAEIDVQQGGQPVYPYFLSVE